MPRTVRCKPPMACTDEERREFARLVRQGFPAAQRLDDRIRAAKWLAFQYAADGALGAVAAIKAPHERYRVDLFEKADAPVNPADYEHELGWVFVAPVHRRNGIATELCRRLLERVPGTCVFATTRTTNVAMMAILGALGFARVGRPYRRRDEQLMLFLRP